MKRIAIALVMLAMPIVVQAARLLGPEQATDAATSILKGPPYGSTKADVVSKIRSQTLIIKGNDPCSNTPVKAPAWVFRIESTDQNSRDETGKPSLINGFLTIDAASGKMTCAGLPYLD